MKNARKIIAALLAVLMLASLMSSALAIEPDYMTRGATADILLKAADDYNPGVQRSDIIKGYPNGDLDEGGKVTRVQALVMLSRAFGDLPEPVGDNARNAYSSTNFTDVPEWASAELADVFASGIVAGTSATTLSPDSNITEYQLDLFIQRVYALEGTNLKDDFYASVNKTTLDSSVILPGYTGTGSFSDLAIQVNSDVAEIIREAASAPSTDGEKKISALYNNILDTESRNKAGIAPIKPYLDAIDSASSLDELMQARQTAYDGFAAQLLLGFGLNVDAKDSTVYSISFSSIPASLGQSGYSGASQAQKSAYIKYISTLFELLGDDSQTAAENAQLVWNTEAEIASHSLSNQDYGNVDKTYNLFTMAQLQEYFPNVDLSAIFAQSGLAQTDKIVVRDVGAMTAAAVLFDEAHLDTLKTLCRLSIAAGYGACFNEEFTTAANTFNQEYIGISGALSPEDTAAQYVQNFLSDYLGEAYVSRHFSAQAKADVEQMVRDIISVYKDRIQALDWMSDSTKERAVRKLDAIKLKIGYPDAWSNDLDSAQLLTASEGGSFFDNIIAIQKAYLQLLPERQKNGPDKDEFGLPAYTVNAQYNPSNNSIEFPAGILHAPFYDVNASYEKNLGSIGYVIAHEITHAFDNNGAKYDENGNAADWWTQEDYAAFQQLCSKVTELYDGRESYPGIACSGDLTLSENIADLGSMACITELESRRANVDYKTLYASAAEIWCTSYSREMNIYLSQNDVHAPSKLRGSLVMQNFQEFYDAFGITQDDGMWLAPAERVTIW